MTPTTTAGPATATATSRPIRRHRALVAALALAGAATLAACGGSGGKDELTGPAAPANASAFAWVHPDRPGAGWSTKALPSGDATLSYPAGWRLSRTDPGTVTATLHRGGRIDGYLNITPQGGAETLANWASFRPAHNREEGDTRPGRARLGHRAPVPCCDGLLREGSLRDRDEPSLRGGRLHRPGPRRHDGDRRRGAALALEPLLAGDRAVDLELRGQLAATRPLHFGAEGEARTASRAKATSPTSIRPRKLRKSISDP